MKTKFRLLNIAAIAVLIFSTTACTASAQTAVPGSSLAQKLAWLATNAQSNTKYLLELTSDEYVGDQDIFYSGKNNITLTIRGVGQNRNISKSTLIIFEGVTLILDNNITLYESSPGKDIPQVFVHAGGTFIMNNGSTITEGGGVIVGGSFIMNGGTISNNWSSKKGGGVYVNPDGNFTMNGGSIADNSALMGGGVYIAKKGTFTMTGGNISGNDSSNGMGGGVFVDENGTFKMSNGNITNNTAALAGGLAGASPATFTMSGGTISGNAVKKRSDGTWGQRGGVLFDGTFTMSGNALVSGNTADDPSGGVDVAGR